MSSELGQDFYDHFPHNVNQQLFIYKAQKEYT